jgi:(5-formylfuran-3-yl)methyl phosphate synthase
MRLMISVISETEASQAILGGADLLDVKNPAEGSLGAQFPHVIRAITNLSIGKAQVSAAIGDMPNLPGTAALAALGAASCGVDYVKVGLYGAKNEKEAITLLREVKLAVDGYKTSVIAALYADFQRAGTLDPESLPELAATAGVNGCLIDTAVKDGSTLFDFISPIKLRQLAEQAHKSGLIFGAAGTLKEKDLPLVLESGADVVGVRTTVCRNHQRTGPLDPNLVQQLKKSLER